MEEDPALYTRFAKMVQAIIDAFREGRLSDAEYLIKARDVRTTVVRETQGGGRADVPETVRGNALTAALYGQAEASIREISGSDTEEIATLIAVEFATIIDRHKRVGWVNDVDIEKLMRQDMDDFLLDEIKGRRGQYGLDFDLIDAMLDQAIARARKLAAQ
jgi:type I restriction enzyme R subunit